MIFNKSPLRQARNPNSQLPVSDDKVREIVKNLGIYQPSQELESTIRVVGAVIEDLPTNEEVQTQIEEAVETITVEVDQVKDQVDINTSAIESVSLEVVATQQSVGVVNMDLQIYKTNNEVAIDSIRADTSANTSEIDLLKDSQSSGQVGFTTWAALSIVPGTTVGALAQVIGDSGTHTDPVSGTTVPNNGQYRWTGAYWEWIRADSLSVKADKVEVEAMIDNKVNYDIVAASVIFDDRSRTWLEVATDGRPTNYAADLLTGRITPAISTSVKADIGYQDTAGLDDLGFALVYGDRSVVLSLDRNGEPTTKIPRFSQWPAVAYGDSTTAGADLVNPVPDRWTRLLEAYTGQTILNYGVSGERSDEVQFRAGAYDIKASVPSGVINATGNTTITMDGTDPLRANTAPQSVTILCEGGERIEGRLTASGSTRLFSRSIPGSAVNTTKITLMNASGRKTKGRVTFLGMGINDEPLINPTYPDTPTRTISEVKEWYRSAIENLSPDNPIYVIWGILDRGAVEAAGTPNGDYIREMERWLSEEYGNRFCKVRQFLSSQYAFTIAVRFDPSFVPTTADLEAVAVGTIPASFRANSTSVHLNPLGHKLQAWFMNQHLIARGII